MPLKRNRPRLPCIKWSREEAICLLTYLEKYKSNIIEKRKCSKTDETEKNYWILKQMAVETGCQRKSLGNGKKKWKNLCQASKQHLAEQNKAKGTGGGSPTKMCSSYHQRIDELVTSIRGRAFTVYPLELTP